MAEQGPPNWGRLMSLGMETAVGVALGVIVGTWVDHRYKTDPWGILIGSTLGLAGGIYLLVKEAIRANKN
jgi:F0F1-type ATP synthase assembly protein I